MMNVDIHKFDKTLFSISSGDYMFSNVIIMEGQMSSIFGQMMMIANSIVFDVDSANIMLNYTQINGISTSSSSPVMLITNSASAS